MASPVSITFKMSMPSASGAGRKLSVNSSSMRRWSDKMSKDKINHGRRTLRRAAAFARVVMRNGFKKGKVTKKQRNKQVSLGAAGYSRIYRKPSPSGSAPRYWTSGRQFGIKTIVYARLNPDTYSIGAVSKSKKRSKFNVPEMLEFGGRGQVLMPDFNNDTKETANLWSKITKAGGKAASVWTTGRYKPRPYASIVVKPTVDKFHDIFGR